MNLWSYQESTGGGESAPELADSSVHGLRKGLTDLRKLIVEDEAYIEFQHRQDVKIATRDEKTDQKVANREADMDRGQVLHWVVTIIDRDIALLAKEHSIKDSLDVKEELGLLRGLHALQAHHKNKLKLDNKSFEDDQKKLAELLPEIINPYESPTLG